MDKNLPIQIRILEVRENAFHLKPIPQDADEPKFGKNLNIGFNFNMRIQDKHEKVIIENTIFYSIRNYPDRFIELAGEIHYHIQPLSNVIQKHTDGRLDIKNQVMNTLISTSIGTMRGLLAANTKGSQWAKYPLPLMNPADILKHFQGKG